MKACAITLLMLELVSAAWAQFGTSAQGHFGTGASAARGANITAGPSASGQRTFSRGLEGNTILLGAPWFADYLSLPAPFQPQPIVVIENQPVAAAPTEEVKPASSLLIEWQGDRFVRFNGNDTTGRTVNAQADYSQVKTPISFKGSPSGPAGRDLRPAVLVYCDGHREEVGEYAIVSGVIYAQGDYWASGHWTRPIQLSTLNLPETVRASAERGVIFRLPSAPNEVVTRP